MRLLIAGELDSTPCKYALFESADLRALVGEEIENMITQSDFFILNLDAPLVDEDTPIAKCGPNLIVLKRVAGVSMPLRRCIWHLLKRALKTMMSQQ